MSTIGRRPTWVQRTIEGRLAERKRRRQVEYLDGEELVFDEALVCFPNHIEYDFHERVGRLFMDNGSCCDMAGCIAIFEAIDPHVLQIQTFTDDSHSWDSVYMRERLGAKWEARCAPRSVFNVLPPPATRSGFQRAYQDLSGAGVCDAPGGVEYHRIWAEWHAADRPYPIEAFIRERANVGPWLVALDESPCDLSGEEPGR